jgi:hypothetical protein
MVMPAIWSSPQQIVSITHFDNLLPHKFTFLCFPNFREIFLPNLCKYLYSNSSNISTPF